MGDMQERLVKETKKMEVAERRRKMELEGYGADLQAMRKKIVFFQRYIMKLKKLVNEEANGDNELVDMTEVDEEEDEEQNQQDDEDEDENN